MKKEITVLTNVVIYSICFIVFYGCSAFNSTKNNEYCKYYKHLVFRETPYAPVKGRVEISKERSKNENHYKLTFNKENRLILIEYLYGDKQINRKRAGIMDGFRNIHSKTVIQYQENLEIRTFFNSNGRRCNNGMNVFKEVYEYNKYGRRIGVKFYNENNQLTNNTWNIAEYIWEHVGENDVIEKRKNNNDEYVTMRPYYHFYTTLYSYSKKGLLISMSHINKDKSLVNDRVDTYGIAIDKPTYDKECNLIGFKFYNAKNEPTVGSFLKSAGGKIEYDSNGNCIKYTTVNLNGKRMLSRGKAYDVYKFDVFGNMVEITHFDMYDKPVKYRGNSKIKIIYDAKDLSIKGKIQTFK